LGFNYEQRPANTPWVCIQAKLSLPNVADDGDLWVDVVLATKLFQGLNEVGWVTVDTHPDTIDKHFRCDRR
jgi:hypothetical protein